MTQNVSRKRASIKRFIRRQPAKGVHVGDGGGGGGGGSEAGTHPHPLPPLPGRQEAGVVCTVASPHLAV